MMLLTNLLFAQELIWNSTGGPMGGIIGGLDINSNGDIYAGAYPFFQNYNGIFKSTDKGNSWAKIETQFEDFQVFSIFITKGNDIWVGTEGQGVLYLSTDNGQTWENKATGYGSFECWAIGESKDGILFAGDADAGKLYRSTNNGNNWEYLGNIAPLSFVVDTNNTVYTGTFNGLFSSTDNGITWIQYNFFNNVPIASVIIDAHNNIYCGTGYYDSGDGVFFSTDGGQNWRSLGLTGKEVLSLAFDSKGTLYAGTQFDGLFKTSDMGQTWTQHQNGIYKKEIFRLKIDNDDNIFIGSEGGGSGFLSYGGGGVFKSTNRGDSFEQVGIPISSVRNIVFSGDSLIFTSTPSGVQKYNRITNKWKNIGLHEVEAIAITNGNLLYVATHYDGLYKSTDLGENWLLTNLTADTLMPVYNVLAINDDTVFVSTSYNLRLTIDGGENWSVRSIITGDSKGLFFKNNSLLLTALHSGSYALYKTTDFGESFELLYSGINTWNFNNPVYATENGYVFLVSRGTNLDGIVRSTDDGLNWEQVLFNDKLAATVFANEDGLVITGSIVFTNSDTNKVLLSTDFGNSWTSFVQPTDVNNSIRDIKQDPMKNLFFGTSSEGLFQVDIITDVDEKTNKKFNYFLSQNFPNPFNPATKIKFTLPNVGRRVSSPYKTVLKVYDVLGNEVATLVNEEKPAGNYEVEFNGEGLSSGIYFYRLYVGSFIETKKMVLLR